MYFIAVIGGFNQLCLFCYCEFLCFSFSFAITTLAVAKHFAQQQQQHPGKRIQMPQVPDLISRSPGPQPPVDPFPYGSIGIDESFPPPPSPLVTQKTPNKGELTGFQLLFQDIISLGPS